MSEETYEKIFLFQTSGDNYTETNLSSLHQSVMTDVCGFLQINSTDSIRELLADKNCFRHSFGWILFFSVIYFLILICGLIGNSLVIFVVLWKPRMRTVTNMFILNLAVADLFVIVFCVPATLLANIFIPWILGEFMCSYVAYIQGVSIFSSVYSLVAVSVDRCRGIHRPMDISHGLSKPQALVLIAFIWLTAVVITLPWKYVFEIVYTPETGSLPFCHENWANNLHGQIYFVLVNLLLCYCCPLILIIIFNSIIWKSVSSRRIPQTPSSSSASNTICHIDQMHRTTKLRVLKMLTSLTLAFFLCWLPLYIVMTRLKIFGVPNHQSWEMELIEVVIPISQVLGSSNSCMNPILYAFLNKKFRETLKSLFTSSYCCFGHRNHRQSRIVSWRRRSDGTHHVRLPETFSNVGLNRRDCSPHSSGNWSRPVSPCPNNMQIRSSSPTSQSHQHSAYSTHLTRPSSSRRRSSYYSNSLQGSSLSHNSKECMCTHF